MTASNRSVNDFLIVFIPYLTMNLIELTDLAPNRTTINTNMTKTETISVNQHFKTNKNNEQRLLYNELSQEIVNNLINGYCFYKLLPVLLNIQNAINTNKHTPL